MKICKMVQRCYDIQHILKNIFKANRKNLNVGVGVSDVQIELGITPNNATQSAKSFFPIGYENELFNYSV